jgi:hypothetical protein
MVLARAVPNTRTANDNEMLAGLAHVSRLILKPIRLRFRDPFTGLKQPGDRFNGGDHHADRSNNH